MQLAMPMHGKGKGKGRREDWGGGGETGKFGVTQMARLPCKRQN